ncbi:MAG TPA: NAD(P)-dependent alcohol dehydrogenase [Actinomycetota bacterium]|nr:NAD(P)-dependent alcohol dehydrogenase [Actinomycetota bacterium]
MKAIVQDRFGSADVLELRDVEEPGVGPDEVRVQVRAAGAGPDVWHLMTGQPYFARLMPGFRKIWGHPRGRDVAGIVDAVGANVDGIVPGDEVMGIAEGSFAELAVGTAELMVRKPTRLSFEEAAAAPISGLTALQAIRDVAQVQPGQRVLVIGAGGGVGTLTVQVAKAFGAHVTAVASTSKLELVRSLGADEVMDYTRQELAGRWDAIVDTAGRRPLRVLRRLLSPTGALAIVGGDGGGRWTGGFFRQVLRAPLLSAVTRQRLRPVVSKESGEDLRALAELIERGDVTPVVDRTFDLVEAADAIRYLEQGHPAGKVVVTV